MPNTPAVTATLTTDLATTVTVIDACGRAHVPVLLKSDPGMGKSSLIRSIAAQDDLLCETVLGSIREPADLAGLPVVTDAGMVLEPPAWAKRLCAADGGYLFLDELMTCVPSVQAAMLAVALDRVVGDLTLPPGVRVVAGGNPPDRGAGGYELEPPLANRFCHLDFAPTTEEWLTGMTSGWSVPPTSRAIAADRLARAATAAAVTGFIQVQPNRLHEFPTTADATGGPWPSRRSWAMLAAALAHTRDYDTAARQALAFGLVGEGTGVAFLTWWRDADLPDPAAVIEDPSIVDWSGRPDRVWAVLNGVVGWATARRSAEAWRAAWAPMVACAEHGGADVATAAVRALGRIRPASATVPASARRFTPILQAAGLIDPEQAA